MNKLTKYEWDEKPPFESKYGPLWRIWIEFDDGKKGYCWAKSEHGSFSVGDEVIREFVERDKYDIEKWKLSKPDSNQTSKSSSSSINIDGNQQSIIRRSSIQLAKDVVIAFGISPFTNEHDSPAITPMEVIFRLAEDVEKWNNR